MSTEKTRSISPITEVLQERAFEAQRRQAEELAGLEGEIGEIDRLRAAARACLGNADGGRSIGADVLWSDWILQRRADLLRQSAMAHARQSETLARARLAFARNEAALALDEAERNDRSRLRTAADRRHLEEQMILKAISGLRDGDRGT